MPTESALRDYSLEKLESNGYVSVPFGMAGAELDGLFSAFNDVIQEIETARPDKAEVLVRAFKTEFPGRPYDSHGFIERRVPGQVSENEIGCGPGTDLKDQLHFTPLTNLSVMEQFRTRGGIPWAIKRLLGQCIDIHETAKTALRPTLKSLGVEDILLATELSNDVHILRVIRYIGDLSLASQNRMITQDALAELHFDRSKCTAAIWESADGLVGAASNNLVGEPGMTLEQFDTDGHLALGNPIRHHSGHIKFFAGAGYNHLPPVIQKASGNIRPLIHGVVNNHPGNDRYAVVLFMNHHAGHTMGVSERWETGFSNVRKAIIAADQEVAPIAS